MLMCAEKKHLAPLPLWGKTKGGNCNTQIYLDESQVWNSTQPIEHLGNKDWVSPSRWAEDSILEPCTCQSGVGQLLRGFKASQGLRIEGGGKMPRGPGNQERLCVDLECGSSGRDHGHQQWMPNTTVPNKLPNKLYLGWGACVTHQGPCGQVHYRSPSCPDAGG